MTIGNITLSCWNGRPIRAILIFVWELILLKFLIICNFRLIISSKFWYLVLKLLVDLLLEQCGKNLLVINSQRFYFMLFNLCPSAMVQVQWPIRTFDLRNLYLNICKTSEIQWHLVYMLLFLAKFNWNSWTPLLMSFCIGIVT